MSTTGLCAKIDNHVLCFNTHATIVHIDYGAMSDVYDLRWNRIAILHKFFPSLYMNPLRTLLDSKMETADKISGLPKIFQEFAVTRIKKGFTATTFPVSLQ